MRKQSSSAIRISCELLLAGATLFACTLASACRRQAAAPVAAAPLRVAVAVQPVRVQAVPRRVAVVGTLHGDEEIALAAKVGGRIVAVAYDVGDTVLAGAELARVEADDYALAVRQKEAALRAALAEVGLAELPAGEFDGAQVPAVVRARVEATNAQARWQRGEAMFAEQPPLITDQERTDLRAALDAAAAAHAAAVADAQTKVATAAVRAAELAQSCKQLADAVVVAPAGGPWRVGRRHVGVGDHVAPGTPLFELVDSDPIEFRADVPERWSGAVRKGQAVAVTVPAQAQPLRGEVARLAPVADPRKRTFVVEIQLANAEGALLPGGFARGAIETHVDPAVVFVPQDAVVVALGVSKVFTVADGKAVEHQVVTGERDGAWLEIVQGDLPATAAVVVSGAARLANGVAVEVGPAPGARQ